MDSKLLISVHYYERPLLKLLFRCILKSECEVVVLSQINSKYYAAFLTDMGCSNVYYYDFIDMTSLLTVLLEKAFIYTLDAIFIDVPSIHLDSYSDIVLIFLIAVLLRSASRRYPITVVVATTSRMVFRIVCLFSDVCIEFNSCPGVTSCNS